MNVVVQLCDDSEAGENVVVGTKETRHPSELRTVADYVTVTGSDCTRL